MGRTHQISSTHIPMPERWSCHILARLNFPCQQSYLKSGSGYPSGRFRWDPAHMNPKMDVGDRGSIRHRDSGVLFDSDFPDIINNDSQIAVSDRTHRKGRSWYTKRHGIYLVKATVSYVEIPWVNTSSKLANDFPCIVGRITSIWWRIGTGRPSVLIVCRLLGMLRIRYWNEYRSSLPFHFST